MNKNFSNINNSNNNFFANQKIIFIISLIIMSFSSFISVFAVNVYLYNANDVSYNNSSSGLSSSDVQDAINELYAYSSNYSDLQSRIAVLEGRWQNNPTSYFSGNGLYIKQSDSSDNFNLALLDTDGNERGAFYYSVGTGQTRLSARAAGGGVGSGTLNLLGNPVMVNDGSILSYKGSAPSNLNDITDTGIYYLNGTTRTNQPSGSTWAYLISMVDGSSKTQIIITNGAIFTRRYSGNPAVWNSWYKFAGTGV